MKILYKYIKKIEFRKNLKCIGSIFDESKMTSVNEDREAYDVLEAARFQSMRSPYTEGMHWLFQGYLDIFRVHSKINVWKILVIMFIYMTIFFSIFQKYLIKIYRALCGPNERILNSKPSEKVECKKKIGLIFQRWFLETII